MPICKERALTNFNNDFTSQVCHVVFTKSGSVLATRAWGREQVRSSLESSSGGRRFSIRRSEILRGETVREMNRNERKMRAVKGEYRGTRPDVPQANSAVKTSTLHSHKVIRKSMRPTCFYLCSCVFGGAPYRPIGMRRPVPVRLLTRSLLGLVTALYLDA